MRLEKLNFDRAQDALENLVVQLTEEQRLQS
jgi:hypothetical protein